jgi:intron-binding protein aquarius
MFAKSNSPSGILDSSIPFSSSMFQVLLFPISLLRPCLDFQGSGESSLSTNSYQNLGEAEYIVALYQYMRLLGYPADKITILTTYGGQRQLISEIIAQRCKKPYFGKKETQCNRLTPSLLPPSPHFSHVGPPNLVTTVDNFRGQQNDYVLLSLVRTSSIGYLRDVHRLIVALSRARLGLYVMCRKELFDSTPELLPIFQQLPSNATALQLVKNEVWPPRQPIDETVPSTEILEIPDVTAMGLKVYEMTLEVSKRFRGDGR